MMAILLKKQNDPINFPIFVSIRTLKVYFNSTFDVCTNDKYHGVCFPTVCVPIGLEINTICLNLKPFLRPFNF